MGRFKNSLIVAIIISFLSLSKSIFCMKTKSVSEGYMNVVKKQTFKPEEKFKIVESFDIRGRLFDTGDIFYDEDKFRISPCGRYVARVSQESTLSCYDLKKKSKIFVFKNDVGIGSFDISVHGKYVVLGSNDGFVKIFNMLGKNKEPFFECKYGKERSMFREVRRPVVDFVRFSSNGKYLVATSYCSDNFARVYNIERKQKIFKKKLDVKIFKKKLDVKPKKVFLTDNGKYLAVIGNNLGHCICKLITYDVFYGRKILEKISQTTWDEFEGLGITDTGKYLFYTNFDGLVLRDIKNKTKQKLSNYYNCDKNGLLLSKCGKYVISLNYDDLLSRVDLRVCKITYYTKSQILTHEFSGFVKFPQYISQVVVDPDGDNLFIVDFYGSMAKIKTSSNFYHAQNCYAKREEESKNIQRNLKKFRKNKKLLDLAVKLESQF